MKNRLPILLLAALVAGNLTAQAAPSAEEILGDYVKALGGETAYKKFKTRKMDATFEMPGAGLSADMTIISKAPNKMHTSMDMPGVGKIEEGFDGKVGWSKNPFTGLVVKDGEQLKQATQQADFYRDVEIAKRYDSWKVTGTEKVGDEEAYELVGSSKDGESETIYIGKESHLLRKVKAMAAMATGTAETSTLLSNYKEVDGVKFPFLLKVHTPEGDINIKIKDIKNGVDAPDSLFEKPAN